LPDAKSSPDAREVGAGGLGNAGRVPQRVVAPVSGRARLAGGRSRRAEGGFTLIEVIVTVALVALLLIPLGRIFYETQSVAADNSARQQAATLATAVISKLSLEPYAELGFASSTVVAADQADPGYYTSAKTSDCGTSCGYYLGTSELVTLADSFTTAATPVTVGSPPEALAPYLASVDWSGRVFTVTTWILWASSTVPSCPTSNDENSGPPTTVLDATKQVRVEVVWRSASAGTVSFVDSSLLYPGGLAPYRGPSYDAADQPLTPGTPVAASTTTTAEVKVSWQVPSDTPTIGCYVVSWVGTDHLVQSTPMMTCFHPLIVCPENGNGSGTASFVVGGLVQNEEYTFFVTAYSPNGVEWATSADSNPAVAPAGPLVDGVSPAYGPAQGGTVVTVDGSGLGTGMTVSFGSGSGAPLSCGGSTTQCTTTAPPGTGIVFVVVTDLEGISSPAVPASQFSYAPAISSISPSSGPLAGGTSVTVDGTNFVPGATTIEFGGVDASSVSCTSTTQCTAVSPASASATTTVVDVTATTAGGTSPITVADKFTYEAS